MRLIGQLLSRVRGAIKAKVRMIHSSIIYANYCLDRAVSGRLRWVKWQRQDGTSKSRGLDPEDIQPRSSC